jgi:hypothetical protein
MPTPIPVPESVERAWRDAPPGREAACQNEILRELRRLLQPRLPPRWLRNAGKEKPGAEAGPDLPPSVQRRTLPLRRQ